VARDRAIRRGAAGQPAGGRNAAEPGAARCPAAGFSAGLRGRRSAEKRERRQPRQRRAIRRRARRGGASALAARADPAVERMVGTAALIGQSGECRHRR
jgi:hypothetical protein